MAKQVENDLNFYEDDGKTDQHDESNDDDEDEIDEFDDQPRDIDKFILKESDDSAHNFPNTKTGYTSHIRNTNHIFCSIFHFC